MSAPITNAIGPDGKPRVFYLIKMAHAALARATERAAESRGGVTGVQMGALFVLSARGPLLMKDLAEELAINNPAITGLASRMEDAGLVTREADSADGRAIRIAATAKGLKAAQAALPFVRAMNAAVLEGFNAQEISVIARFLSGLPARAEAQAEQFQQSEKRRKP
jgi:DNA-binding MarR family transcriptional regulator